LADIADDRFRDRFWSKVDRSGVCWVWRNHRKRGGYGQFTVTKGDFRHAHIVSYALTKGPVPPGMQVCHHCDNPPCVRPDHLFLGTASANALDMFSKGRQGARYAGTAKPGARLNEDSVRAIRATGRYYGCIRDLARQYGVSDTVIRKVRAGVKWRHVQ
jgi:hypothetical protein